MNIRFRNLKKFYEASYTHTGSILPLGYHEVERIQSGGQQYISTGISISGDLSFDIKFYSHNSYGTSGYGCIFGAQRQNGSKELQLTTYESSSLDGGTFRLGDNGYAASLNKTGINVVQYDVDGKYIVNGATIHTIEHPSFTQATNITLFALNNRDIIKQYGNVEMYYFKLYKNGVLVRDYVPCIRESDNTPGMFDLVSNTFYGSATSTPFVVPTV